MPSHTATLSPHDAARTKLRVLIMRADRARFGASVLVLLCTSAPPALLFGGLSFLGLLLRTLLLAAHRTILIRMVPPPPSPSSLTLRTYLRAHAPQLLATLGGLCALALLASLDAHALPLPPPFLRASADCPAPHATLAELCALLVGLAAVAQYAASPSLRTPRWPLLLQDVYLRLRPHALAAAADGLRLAGGCLALALCLRAARHSLAPPLEPRCDGTDGAVAASGLLLLLLRGAGFLFSVRLSFIGATVAYTQPLSFEPSRVGAEEDVLQLALEAHDKPLTQHLAFLDVFELSEMSPTRRSALYTSRRGVGWPKLLNSLLRPIDAMTLALEHARKQPSQPIVRMAPGAGKLWRLLASWRHIAVCSQMFGASQLVIWATQASANLVAASIREDVLGTVQLNDSLEKTLGTLLRCLLALDGYVGQGATVGVPSAMTRLRLGSQPRSQQDAALLVSEAMPAYLRAVGAQRATALESALQRSVYLLVHTFQDHISRVRLPLELQTKLDLFIRGIA